MKTLSYHGYTGPTMYQDWDGTRCSWECLSEAGQIRVARHMVAGRQKIIGASTYYTSTEAHRFCQMWRDRLDRLEAKHGAIRARSDLGDPK